MTASTACEQGVSRVCVEEVLGLRGVLKEIPGVGWALRTWL